MNEPTPRFWEIFFEVYETLPRQGPGNRTSADKALSLCSELPSSPMTLDLGCGTGGQTIYLAQLTSGNIIAIDSHSASIRQLKNTLNKLGLSRRVWPVVCNMADPALPPMSFDLIWSEGALYNVGLEKALQICHQLLRLGGYLAFTDAVWRKQDPPPELKASFDLEYPTMGSVSKVIETISAVGFLLVGHFTVPDEAWWDDFYTPMQLHIEELRGKYARERDALAVLEQLWQEPMMHLKYSEYYAYEFFVVRRQGQ